MRLPRIAFRLAVWVKRVGETLLLGRFDSQTLKAAAHSVSCAGEKDGGAAGCDIGCCGARVNGELLDLTEDEEKSKTRWQFIGAATDRVEYLVALRSRMRAFGEGIHLVVRIDLPPTALIEEVFEKIAAPFLRIDTIGGQGCRRSLLGAEVIENLEFQDTDEPGAELRSFLKLVPLFPSDEENVLHEILGRVMVTHLGKRVSE